MWVEPPSVIFFMVAILTDAKLLEVSSVWDRGFGETFWVQILAHTYLLT